MKFLKIFIFIIIRIYQRIISPFIGNKCRYIPSCSEYMILSMKKKGILKSFFMTIKRIINCHPWSKYGYDPPN